jgi:hypothetical protein
MLVRYYRPMIHPTVDVGAAVRAGARWFWRVAACLFPLSVAAQAPASRGDVQWAWARVAYLSGSTVYLDAGRRAGARVGSRVEVVRGTTLVAVLKIEFISSSRSACAIIEPAGEVVVGDSVRFVAVPESSSLMAARSGGAAGGARSRRRDAVRGRLGVRYLTSEVGGSRATQPAFDLRLDARQLGGSPLGITADVRAYRDRRTSAGRTTLAASTRVYQSNLEFAPAGGGTRLAVGRQMSTAIATVGIFDGLALEHHRPHLSLGAFGGTQPDIQSFGFSPTIREYGAHLQWHNAPNATAQWNVTLGGVGSYDSGEIDREFVYLQTMVTRRRFSLYASQEIDFNRGWRAEAEHTTTVPTATFAMARWSLVDAVTLHAGFDNRRSVRLYRDFLSPEVEFDDAIRQGEWGGISLTLGPHARVDGDARRAHGGTNGRAESYTASARLSRLTPLGLGLGGRGTRYAGDAGAGELASALLEVAPLSWLRVEGSAGTRTDRRATAGLRQRLDWRGLDADLTIGRSWYLLLSIYQERGDQGSSRQAYGSLSWRF